MAQTLVIAVGDAGERLRPLMLDRIANLKVGPGMEPGMDMGPIYSAEHRESVMRWIDVGEAEGAELVVDGRPFHHPENPDGFFLGVTLFDHVTPDMEIYQEEIFGPVLGIVHARTYDEALGLINGHKYANGTAIFTTDGGAARRFKLEVDVPMIGVNVPIPVPAGYLSFGGSQGVVLRRPGDARRGRDPLLHPAEDGHRALAGARPPRHPLPGLPRQRVAPTLAPTPGSRPGPQVCGPGPAPEVGRRVPAAVASDATNPGEPRHVARPPTAAARGRLTLQVRILLTRPSRSRIIDNRSYLRGARSEARRRSPRSS